MKPLKKAIREAVEELNILKSSIEILGKLPSTLIITILLSFVGIHMMSILRK